MVEIFFLPHHGMCLTWIQSRILILPMQVGLYPASSVGDDIEVYEDESRSTVKAKLFGLRQQVRGDCAYGT